MDYNVDKRIGDRTFAVACGKRAAALFPAAIFLCSLFIVVAVIPSERIARYSFLAMFLVAVAIVSVRIASFVLR